MTVLLMDKSNNKSFRQNILNIIFVTFCFFSILYYVVNKEGVENIKLIFKEINYIFLLFAIVAMVLYWGLESFVLHIFCNNIYKNQSFKKSIKTSMIGQFFNSITPFSSGGQPIQAYYMMKLGMNLGDATCILMSKFIVYQISITVLSLLLLTTQISYFNGHITGFKTLVFIGFFINIFVVFALLAFSISKKFCKNVAFNIIIFLSKLKIIKYKNKCLEYTNKEIDIFSSNIKNMKSIMPKVILSAIITLLQLIVYFSVSYFVYLSFGLNGNSIITFIAAQSFVNLISAFIPSPGGSGGAEISFLAFYSILFPSNYINVSMFIWRLLTYYLTIFVSFLFLGKVFNKK
ncbi:MAG: lysylphosphatidylglycerol synthase transmembrane domain-containing protein [Oscillospiraceae bacterium]